MWMPPFIDSIFFCVSKSILHPVASFLILFVLSQTLHYKIEEENYLKEHYKVNLTEIMSSPLTEMLIVFFTMLLILVITLVHPGPVVRALASSEILGSRLVVTTRSNLFLGSPWFNFSAALVN